MRTAIRAALALLSLDLTAAADDPTEFRLKDGRVVVGEIASFASGVYLVRSGGEVVRVPEREIRTIVPVTAPDALPPADAAEIWMAPEDHSAEAAQALAEGLTALEAGQPEAARPSLERAKQLDPWSVAVRLALARVHERCGDAGQAERELRQVLAVDPANVRAIAALKELFDRTGQRAKSDLLVVDSLRARFPAPEAEYRAARHFLANGDLDRASVHWNRYLEIRPSPAPSWDVEARMMAEADAFAAAGVIPRAVERCYDLMRYNPLERDKAVARIRHVQETAIETLLAARDLPRACAELDALAAIEPSRAQAYHERSAKACSDELSRLLTEGDTLALGRFLEWLSQRYLAKDVDGLLATAIGGTEAPAAGLAAVHRFLVEHPEHRWEGSRTRLVLALEARLKRGSDDAIQAAETLEELDPDRADEWRSRKAQIARALGMTALAEANTATAVFYLSIALTLLPDDEEIASALEQAEMRQIREQIAGACNDAEKHALLEAFVASTASEANAAWGRKELERLRTLSSVESALAARKRKRYFPLSLGTRWVYAWSDGREDEIRVAAVSEDGAYARIDLEVRTRPSDTTVASVVEICADQHRVWQEKVDGSDIWLRFPVLPGTTWETSTGRIKIRRTYQSTSETVDTRIGTFRNCLKVLYETIDASGGTIASEMYYAPDVGLVKMTTPGRTSMEIVEFTAGQEGE